LVTPGVIVGQGLGNPKYVFTTSAQRDFTLGGKSGYARLDYNHQGPEVVTAPGSPWADQQTPVIHMLNFSTGVYLTNSFRAGVFFQNLLNDHGELSTVDVGNYGPRSRPRTLGIQFSDTFE
jgi:hypothetical protein